ncbi:uncharacterized protein LOC105771887 [Gossypium raimondii]|uniref:uncharacterized protein LOC105771887 n=1 Tax=Gossypium raimondii TaxID=29730 RepID=UPI00063AF7B3|nr:uncharacterized protein LOC105771887 [Gossypium raimondii]
MKSGDVRNFRLGNEGELRFMRRLYVPNEEDLRKEVLKETHQRPFSVHPGSVEMYQDLRSIFWWLSIKREIIISNEVFNLQRVKAEYQVPLGKLCSLEIPEWKMNLKKYVPLAELTYNNSYHDSLGMSSFKVLCGRKCRSPVCWLELSEMKLVGLKLVCKTEDKVMVIKNHLKIAQDSQKAYTNRKRKDVSYEFCDKVFLKASPWKKIIRFGLKGKLSIRFIRP